jgi:hypothetical protein
MPRSRRSFHVLLSCIIVASCGSDGITSIVGTASQTIVAELGDEVQITLWNVGPGEYVSPPQISSTVLTFLSDRTRRDSSSGRLGDPAFQRQS